METIIFATKNKGKIREINEILADMNVNVVSMEEAGITIDVVEDGKTFEENSMKKAVQVMEISGKITLADDSGLEIDYLDKAPGIYSARFLGEDTPYPEKFKVILEKLKDVEEKDRTARFVSCIVAAFPDGRRLVSLDTVEGIIGWEPTGENGFGYDPIFYVPELKKYHGRTFFRGKERHQPQRQSPAEDERTAEKGTVNHEDTGFQRYP